MKHIRQHIILLLMLLPAFMIATPPHPTRWPNFNQVIIWGHSPHTHTHAYIHAAFFKAFNHLGYKTYWLNDTKSIKGIPLEHTLFITVGGQDRNIPIRSDCLYMIHNCDDPKYNPLRAQGTCIVFQVYTHDARARNVQPLHADCDYILYDLDDSTLYMPWAADLLPDEIDAIKTELPGITKNNTACFVGTIWSGSQGNDAELSDFKRACHTAGIPFEQYGGFGNGINERQHKSAIMHAHMAPAVQGAWQCDHGYIPCRIFKNISYGALGITNNETVYKLFNRKIIYNPDAYQLFFDAQKELSLVMQDQIFELMDFVRDKHTYLNRIDDLLTFFGMVQTTRASLLSNGKIP